jgi:hypothetical protein
LQKLREASIWAHPSTLQAKISILEDMAFQKRQASGDWNTRYGFELYRVPGILFQAIPGDDDPVVGGISVDLCGYYREPEAIQVIRDRFSIHLW